MTSSKIVKLLIVLAVFFGMFGTGYLLYELGYKTEAAYVARNTLIVTILCAGVVTRTAWIVYAALITAIGLNIDLILVALLQLFITLVASKTSGSPIETTFVFFIGLLIALGIIVATVEALYKRYKSAS